MRPTTAEGYGATAGRAAGTPARGNDILKPTDVVGPPCSLAERVYALSCERWGQARETVVLGQDATFVNALERAARFAQASGSVLITGETGTGKELFARTVCLLSDRSRKPFLTVNCAQYHDGHLLASELFGHRRGSFTGAAADHRGVFEEADGGVLFLDEVGELSGPAQAMLLRVLGEGEILAVGSTQAKRVNVRVIAATSRDLAPMVASGRFRPDLYYRLRHLHVHVPALRDRGEDWRLMLEFYLQRLIASQESYKRFSRDAMGVLTQYMWPGNVRELRSLVDTGYCLSDGAWIEAAHFAESLEDAARVDQLRRMPQLSAPAAGDVRDTPGPMDAVRAEALFEQMANQEGSFWDLVHVPYLERNLRRSEVRALIDYGLRTTRGSYKGLLRTFGIAAGDYLKFMDFLRHQDLKPRA